ncbi:hypothetical protein [Acidovorax cavernicola]|uniref:DUF4398 domain-containing protein n=1 Tax=Acidovorax cavernicola TaxID=1675792 RepID=A0A9X8GW69_9BURK|nr:hypothetical protein [Acidovorax cavernicola]RIX82843.1 hypothetical protein D3H34_08340 [Acidovorax cavernicola]
MIRISLTLLLALVSSSALASNWTTSMDNKRKCETAAFQAEKNRQGMAANHYRQCAKEFLAAAQYFRENDQSYNGKTAFQRGLDQYNKGNMQ